MKLMNFFYLISCLYFSRMSRYMTAFFLDMFSVLTHLHAVNNPSWDQRNSSTSYGLASVLPMMQATNVSMIMTGVSSDLVLKNLYICFILFFVNSFYVLTLSISLSFTIFSLASTSFFMPSISFSLTLIILALFSTSSANHFSQSL